MLQLGHMLHPRSLFRNVHQSEEQLMKQMEQQRHSRPSSKMMYIRRRIQCRNVLGYFHTNHIDCSKCQYKRCYWGRKWCFRCWVHKCRQLNK